jgi:hypothetical protein
MAESKYAVSAIDCALDIMLFIFRARREMGITQIAGELGLKPRPS